MRKGKIKRHRRRARQRETLYSLAVDAWDIFLGLVPVWGPVVTAVEVGAVIWLLGW